MEKPKQPQIFKRRRGRGFGEKIPRQELSRQDKQNWWRRASGPSYLPGPKGEAARKRHAKARAKSKRSKTARKKNR